MKILVILHDGFGGHGGIAKFNRDLLGGLAADPDVTSVVAVPRLIPGTEEPIPPKIDFRHDGLELAWRQARAIMKQAGTQKPDLIICGHIRLLPLAWWAARKAGAKLWLIIHGIDAWTPVRPVVTKFLLRRVDRVIAVSCFTQRRFQSWTGYPDDRMQILPNCVDLSRFAPGPRNPELNERYGLVGKPVMLTLGRLVSKERAKGMDEVLEAMPRLLKTHRDLVYIIAGDGPDRGRLMDKAIELGLDENTRFLGQVTETEKSEIYRLADLYVMPSRGEGFGIVFLEALASGLPAIGSTRDGSRDALRDGMLGQLVDPGDQDALIDAIQKGLKQPKLVPAGLDYYSSMAFTQRVQDLLRQDFVKR